MANTANTANRQKGVKVVANTAKAVANAPVQQTALQVARANVAAKANGGIGVTMHTSGAPIKGLAAQPQLAKPTRKMLRTISSIKGHPGKGNCVKRFHLYKVGMTLMHCKTTPGLIPSDVTFYAELGYLTLREATEEEYNAAVAAWQTSKAAEVAA